MKRIRKIYILLVLPIALALLAGAAWIFRQEALQHLARPALEKAAGSALDSDVRIGGIAPAAGGLLFTNVSAHRGDGSLSVVIPEAEVGFTLAGLLGRRLERVALIRPDLSLSPTGERKAPSFPERPLVAVGEIQIRDGGFRIRAPDGPVVFHGIEVRTRGNEPIDFRLTAFAGEGGDHPILMAGKLLWQAGPSLTLDELRWRGTSLLASPLTVRLPSGGDDSAEGAIRFERLDSGQLEALFAVFRKEFPLPPENRFTLFSTGVDFGWELGRLRLQGAFDHGVFGTDGREITLGKSSWMLETEESGWEFESRFTLAEKTSGEVRGEFSEGSLEAYLMLRIPDPGAFVGRISGGSPFAAMGGLLLSGEISRTGANLRFNGSFEGMPGEKRSDHLLDLSSLSGPLVLERAGDAWSGRAGVRIGEREIAEARAEGGEITVSLLPTSGRALHPALGPGLRRAVPAGAENVSARLRISPDGEGWRGSAEIRAGRIPLPHGGALEEVRLSGGFRPGEESVRLAPLRATARLSGEGLPTGELSAAGSGEWSGGRWSLRFDPLTAAGVDYLSPGGDSGFTGGALQASGSVSGKTGGDSITLDLSGALSMKEVLVGAFYAELSDLPARWSLRGTYEPAGALLQAANLSFAVEKIGRLELEGRFAPAGIRTRGRIGLERLGEEFSDRFLPALRERFAAARDLRLSGAVETEFAFERDREGWQARGTVLPGGLDLSRRFVEARNLEGAVPFHIFSGKPPAGDSVGKRSGTLSFTSFSIGPAQYQGKSLSIVSSPNRVEIPAAASFRLANGRVEIEGVSFGRGVNRPEFSAKIDIRDIDLETLTRELGWIEMSGSLDADLGRIRFAGDILSSEGNMVVEVFGGIVLISRIRMESPFSSYPLLLGSVDFGGIDLYQLTRAFSFGAINGIADGFIHDLRLFRFTPSRFEAVLETRERGTRNISVKALENLTLISQGGLSAALSRGIFRFIDFYRYRKIGIWCILDQDVFVLRGTAREGSDRYIVYGGLLPPKIDILAPQHAISFKEMLNRLQRIERTDGGEGEGD